MSWIGVDGSPQTGDVDRREAERCVGGHVVGRIVGVLVGDAGGDDRDGARLFGGEVDVRVERERRRAAAGGRRVWTARRAGDREPVAGDVHRLAERHGDVGVEGDPDRAVGRGRRGDGRRRVARRTSPCGHPARRRCRWRSRPTRPPGRTRSVPTGSPWQTVALRRNVLSAVLVRPAPHSVPGSKPSLADHVEHDVVPLRRTTASSPLNQPEPFVWSACARIAAFAAAWART